MLSPWQLLLLVLLCAALAHPSIPNEVVLTCFLLSVVWIFVARRCSLLVHMHSVDDQNEQLIVEAMLADKPALFMIDTGYAGPPVLSASCLSATDPHLLPFEARASSLFSQMRDVDEEKRHAAIDLFLSTRPCLAYTSGCTMRLMGIGDTVEQQADMMMCPTLRLKTSGGAYVKTSSRPSDADVFVTNSLPSSLHILTCDFLRHSSPCLLRMKEGRLDLNLDPVSSSVQRAGHVMFSPARMSGGAFLVPLKVGGVDVVCTVDTGAPGPICLGRKAGRKVHCESTSTPLSLRQSGVHGEVICSDLVVCDVVFSGSSLPSLPVLLNDRESGHADGFVGLAFLRAFDLFFEAEGVGFRPSGLEPRDVTYFSSRAVPSFCSAEGPTCKTGGGEGKEGKGKNE